MKGTGWSGTWPPPPDLASIKELVRDADVEGFIADGAPLDEYDTEAEEFFGAIADLQVTEITVAALVPLLVGIWGRNLVRDAAQLVTRRPALEMLAAQICRFFGPEARPQVRG